MQQIQSGHMTAGHRERKKQQTRERIIEAAYGLFAERGYQATTVADIAAAADIAPRTFFAYFPAKEDVVFYFGDTYCNLMQAAVESRPEGMSAIEALRQWIATVLPEETVESDEARLRDQMCIDDPALAAYSRKYLARVEDVLREGIARDLGEPSDALRPKLLAAAAAAALDTISKNNADKGSSMKMLDETLIFLRAGAEALSPAAGGDRA
jgi:TetR/AcrR family transcriptional regulator, regulator of mycofactocin system